LVDILGIKIEEDKDYSVVTSYAGLLGHFEFWRHLGMPEQIDKSVQICGSQGWMDRQIVEALVTLNTAGGDCVTDIDKLEADAGLCRMFSRCQYSGLSRAQRKAAQARFRGGKTRTFPAPTQIYSWLEACHDASEEQKRVIGKAFIPQPNEHLRSLMELNAYLVEQVQARQPCDTATLDCDATLIECHSRNALWCYKHFPAFQPYNIYWAEQDLVLHSEFRDGNVPAGYDILRVFQEAVAMLPEGVKTVYVRQDTAAYINELMGWLEDAKQHPKYGRIPFTISADITPPLRSAVAQVKAGEWTKEHKMRGGKQVPTGREYAEVIYMSNAQATLTGVNEAFRFIAIREKLGDQLSLLEVDGSKSPFPVMTMGNLQYKLHAIVTNRYEEPAEDLIRWHYQRCGKSEEAHSVMKSDFAGGQLPSGLFGANAAWWALMILAMNFNSAMKQLVMGDKWAKKRMKALRYDLIVAPGRVVNHARQMFMRVNRHTQQWLFDISTAISRIAVVQT
jgi:hypothetical protein